jgi:LysR family transcriptional regulator for metE and metH
VQPARLLNVQLTEAIVELVRAGLGIGILSRWAVQREVLAGHLRGIPITKAGLMRNWCVLYRNEKRIPGYLMAFVQLLESGPIKAGSLPSAAGISLKSM